MACFNSQNYQDDLSGRLTGGYPPPGSLPDFYQMTDQQLDQVLVHMNGVKKYAESFKIQ